MKYIGTKIVEAEPCGRKLPDCDAVEGYEVVYKE